MRARGSSFRLANAISPVTPLPCTTRLPRDIEIDESKIKDVLEVIDDHPLITPEILSLTQWTADYYASFWGEMLKAALPAGLHARRVRPKRRKAVRLLTTIPDADDKPLTEQQEWILEMLSANGGEMLLPRSSNVRMSVLRR